MQIESDNAYKYCKEIAIRHYENFPVGSLLIPKKKSKYIYSIYAFARHADDIADSEKYSSSSKLNMLVEFENELAKIEINELDSLNTDTRNIFIALYYTIKDLKIPVTEFKRLLVAFKQDAVKQKYSTFEELVQYSEYSANPIGHLVLYVFGYNTVEDTKCFYLSDKVCTALQITNFWQDVSLDLKIGRVYIPENLMKEYNYNYDMLNEKVENDDFRKIIQTLIDKTRGLFDEGKGILNFIDGRLKLEIKATIAGGMQILNKIEKINYNVLSERVKISAIDKLKLAGKIIWR